MAKKKAAKKKPAAAKTKTAKKKVIGKITKKAKKKPVRKAKGPRKDIVAVQNPPSGGPPKKGVIRNPTSNPSR